MKRTIDACKNTQFFIWKGSATSPRGKKMTTCTILTEKEIPKCGDFDSFQEDLTFPSKTSLPRLRNIHLSAKQTKILATLVPDEIINAQDLKTNYCETYVGVLLFADVSGFTSLCEKYNDFGKAGADKLTATLNSYLGALVEVIYTYGGDVLKFSGDAFLALWKVNKNEYIYTTIHKVISCALYIQQNHGNYETEVKVLLKVKLAISAGNMTFSVIGDENSRNYMIVGLPVAEVKAAEHTCNSGEVVLSMSAWGHLSPVNYEYSKKDDENVLITRIIYNPESAKREVMPTTEQKSSSSIENAKIFNFYLKRDHFKNTKNKSLISLYTSEIRVYLQETTKDTLGSDLRMFLIPPVVQQIDADLPLEYLSEMRHVTIMFVNIIPENIHTRNLISLINKAYNLIWELAYKAMGSLSKVSLFDKDVMLLVIFGLRGFHHEGEAANCLKCGYDIRQACSTLEGVFRVSAGVTTGQNYCGVLGHPSRREYTVIGTCVNKAARIVCAYPGKVTCDRETFLFSNLASSFFTLQEYKPLKGIEFVGPIYEFTQEKRRNTVAAMQEGMYPILGREKEISVIKKILKDINNPHRSVNAILIKGPVRSGKTRLLDEIILLCHKMRSLPVVIALHSIHSAVPYGTARYIIKQVLDIPDSANVTDKETLLSSLLEDVVPANQLYRLNELMNVRFPIEEDVSLSEEQERDSIKSIFHDILTLVQSKGTASTIFAIDDVDYCDPWSWDLLLCTIREHVKFLVMTTPMRPRPGFQRTLKIPTNAQLYTLTIPLSCLDTRYLATLACQILSARAIPPQLERILIARSHGNPGWCESFLVSLFQSNCIKIEEITPKLVKQLNLIMPPPELLVRNRFVPDLLPKEEIRSPSLEVDINFRSDRRSTFPTERAYFRGTIQYPRLFRSYDSSNETNANERGFMSPSDKIKHLYDDFQQSIKRFRFQNISRQRRESMSYISDSALDGMDEFSSGVAKKWTLSTKEKSKVQYDPEQTTNDAKVATIKLLGTSDRGYFQIGSSLSRLAVDTNIEQKVREIFCRFPNKRRISQNEETRLLQNIAVVKSVCEMRDSQDILPYGLNPSKSAAYSLHTAKTENGNTKNQRVSILKTVQQSNLIAKNITQDLIEESIQIFKENKEKLKISSKSELPTIPSGGIFTLLVSEECDASKAHSTSCSNARDVEVESNQKNFRSLDRLTRHGSVFEVQAKGSREANGSTALQRRPTVPRISDPTIHKDSSKSIWGKRTSWFSKVFLQFQKGGNFTPDVKTEIDFEDDTDLIPAMLVNPTINLEDVTTPECYVGVIMSAFDCLRPYEQLMLKCGSIIGEKFTRKMLNAIMHDPNPILTSEAVKRLFDMRILCCGSDLIPSSAFRQSEEREIYCACTISTSDIIEDSLPYYSFCQVLKFKYSLFQSTLYELIPNNQKKEFHIRAVEYLKEEKKVCMTCTLTKWEYVGGVISRQVSETGPTVAYQGPVASSFTKITPSNAFEGEDPVAVNLKAVKKEKGIGDPFECAVPRLLSDFRDCECLYLQAEVFEQLIVHCKAAGLLDEEIEILTDYGEILITIGEIREAENILKRALFLCGSFSGETDVTRNTKKERRQSFGKINLNLGRLYLDQGYLEKANDHLIVALKHYGIRFVSSFVCLQKQHQFNVQYCHHYIPGIFVGNFRPKSTVNDEKAACLALLSNVYMLEDKWGLAELVALRSLNTLQIRNTNVIELCNSYSNVIDICRHLCQFKFCWKMESDAAKLCSEQCKGQSLLELIALGRLYCSLFNARLINGHLSIASRLGDFAIDISLKTSCTKAEYYIIRQAMQLKMMTGKLLRAVKLLSELPDHDVWYYILALDFILDTGFAVERATLCVEAIKFALSEREPLDPDMYRRAVASVCVWTLRNLKNDSSLAREAEMWRDKLITIKQTISPDDNLSNLLTGLRLLEAYLLILTYHEKLNLSNLPALVIVINNIFETCEKTAARAKVILPRLLHLQAYYQYRTLENSSQAFRTMDRAKEVSLLQENSMEHAWITHNLLVWSKQAYENEINYWTNCSRNDAYVKWNECEGVSSWQSVMFSLP